MITYQNMTPSQTLEERIVSTINTGIDATASKIVCITDGNLLRYKTLIPIITRTRQNAWKMADRISAVTEW